MAKTYELQRTQFVPRPVDEVFAFFSDAGNLEALTPEFVQFKILTPLPIKMAAGVVIDYRIKLFGIPMKWQTLIESFEPPHRFADTQLRGPYARWHHTHTFTAVDGGTLIEDRVEYQIRFGILGQLTHPLFVRRSLEQIFDYRFKTIERIFGQQPTASN